MGVGKSTISAQLARYLYCKVIDLDTFIEAAEGLKVEDIFKEKGEQYFREKEEYYLKSIIDGNREKVLIISLGGGTLISKANQEIVKNQTFCIYLKATQETQIDRLSKSWRGRPNIEKLTSEEYEKGIRELFETRRSGYEYCCSLAIDVDNKSVKELITEILSSI